MNRMDEFAERRNGAREGEAPAEPRLAGRLAVPSVPCRMSAICVLLITLGGMFAHGAEPITWSPIKLDAGEGRTVDGEFANLPVPERHALPNGKQIRLAVWRLPHTGAAEPANPIIYLHGGPGGNIADTLKVPGMIDTLAALRQQHDVVLFDQRGCGKSEPSLQPSIQLGATPDTFRTRETLTARVEEAARAVLADLQQHGVDVAAYNTLESADDVESLRAALGAMKVDLFGYSYGTHLALSVIRRHEGSIGRAVLCGVEGPDATYKLPSDVQAQFQRVADLCKADPAINKAVPDLIATINAGIKRLDAQPASITVMDPRTRQKTALQIGGFAYQVILAKMYLGRTKDLAYLPRLAQSVATGDGYQLTWGAQRMAAMPLPVASFIVDAASGASPERTQGIARERDGCILGDAANFPFPQINDHVFHVPVLGDDYRTPVKSPTPVLFVSGTLDGHTPPNRTEEIRAGFPHATHLIIENAGHDDVATAAGLGDVMARFLAGADVADAKLTVPPMQFQPIR